MLDWNDLEIVTFDPRRPKHRRLREVLKRPSRDPERAALVRRLETEFCRAYTRYRRAAERLAGRATVTYEVSERERKYAATAAVLCMQRGVTPRQLLRYWHDNLKHFTRAAHMQVPTLSFLSSIANIDSVACGVNVDGTTQPTERARKPESHSGPKGGNSFSDTSDLDVRLRKGLEAAGFETRDYDDRYLMTIQKTAINLAEGAKIFIAKGRLRDMSFWAAKNLYAK